MLKQATDFLWTVITLLYQLVLVTVLIALLMGDGAGGFVMSVYGNVRELLAALNPAAVAVAAVLYLFWQLHQNRIAGSPEKKKIPQPEGCLCLPKWRLVEAAQLSGVKLGEFATHAIQCCKPNHQMFAYGTIIKRVGGAGQFDFTMERLV